MTTLLLQTLSAHGLGLSARQLANATSSRELKSLIVSPLVRVCPLPQQSPPSLSLKGNVKWSGWQQPAS